MTSFATPLDDPAEALLLADDAEAASRPLDHRVTLHAPVDVRSASLVMIAFLLAVYGLYWARPVFVPVLMAVLFSYALTPLVKRLVRWRVPRGLAAAAVLASLVGGLLWTGWALADQADNLIDSLPDAANKLHETARELIPHSGTGRIAQVQKAATQLAQAAAETSPDGLRGPPGVARVQIVQPAFDLRSYLFTGTLRLAEMTTQAAVVVFVTWFLLAAGDKFRRKLARIAGPRFARRKIAVQALDEISEQIQRYLLVQLLSSAVVGACTGAAFAMLGLANASVWAIVAGVLNLVPYVGTVVVCGLSALMALLQFGTLGMAGAVAAVSIVLHTVTGSLLVPWLTSRTSRLNAVVVFVGVLAWGWLWGIWGLLLGTPILMALKAVCDRVDDLKPLGELLGGD